MQSTNWAPEHSDALREYRTRGMSFLEIVDAINGKFRTSYSRSAAIGRAKRMGLSGPKRPQASPKLSSKSRRPKSKPTRLHRLRERYAPEPSQPQFKRPSIKPPIFERTETARLRCVDIVPWHLSVLDLASGDCRYPYGGEEEGEVITFCGHPQREGSSYCTAHFHLTRGPGTLAERSAGIVLLRLVEAA